MGEDESLKKRESSRSRSRRQRERAEEIEKRVEENQKAAKRPGWVVTPTQEEIEKLGQKMARGEGANGRAEPEESREELMKMSVGKLKELLKEYGRSARGLVEKRDFVDRLKPPPKT